MLEKDVKQIKHRMASIDDNTGQILEFLKSATMPKTEHPKPIEHLDVSELTKAVSILVKGDKKFIRVHAGKYDFGVALNDLNDGERLNWHDAMKMAEDDGLRLPNKEELMLMFVFKDEINALLKEAGGTMLNEDYAYWSVVEYYSTYAWCLYFSSCNINICNYYKYNTYTVARGVAAF